MTIILAVILSIWGVAAIAFFFHRSIVKMLTNPETDPRLLTVDKTLRANELQVRYGLSTEYSMLEQGFCVQYNTSLMPQKYVDKILDTNACMDYAKDPQEAIINFANKVGLP